MNKIKIFRDLDWEWLFLLMSRRESGGKIGRKGPLFYRNL